MAAALITFIPIRATRTEYGISTLIWQIFSHVCPAGNSIPKRQRKPLCRKLVAAPAVFRTLMHQLPKCSNFWHRLKQRLHMTPPDPLLCTLPCKALTCEAKNVTTIVIGNKCVRIIPSPQISRLPSCTLAMVLRCTLPATSTAFPWPKSGSQP